tara:strand:- start:187 stop:777 length:591 start_codon:yes stop_codon:yes gene_type:complete
MNSSTLEVRGSTWLKDLEHLLRVRAMCNPPLIKKLHIYPEPESYSDATHPSDLLLSLIRKQKSIVEVFISIPLKSVALEMVLNALSMTAVYVEAIAPNASFNLHSHSAKVLELIDYPIPEESFVEPPPVMFYCPKLESLVDGHGCFAFSGLSSETKPSKMELEDISKVPMERSKMYAYLGSLKLENLQIIEDFQVE